MNNAFSKLKREGVWEIYLVMSQHHRDKEIARMEFGNITKIRDKLIPVFIAEMS